MQSQLRALLIFGVFGLLLGAENPVWAVSGELRELYRGTRAQGFGNAFVAVADDEQTLFYNPAGLAGIKSTRFNYAPVDLEVSGDVVNSPALITSLGNASSSNSLNALMGQDIYLRAQLAPTLVMPNFGVGVIVDQQIAVLAKNPALPAVTLGYQTTDGVQVGTGFVIGKKKAKTEAFTEFRVGVGGKLLWRRGGYRELSVAQVMTLMNSGADSLLSTLAGNYGMGYGVDLGTQVVRNFNSRLSLSAGAAMTEIGNVNFSSDADPQIGNLSAGLALRYKLPLSVVGLAIDYRHILQETDWKMRTHFGGFFELPMVNLYAGFNQFHITYGATFDAWMFRVTAVSYAEEIGLVYGQESERRYLVRFSLGFGM